MILLIDNYDSFVYNLYQFIAEIEPDVKVVRNDEITSEYRVPSRCSFPSAGVCAPQSRPE